MGWGSGQVAGGNLHRYAEISVAGHFRGHFRACDARQDLRLLDCGRFMGKLLDRPVVGEQVEDQGD